MDFFAGLPDVDSMGRPIRRQDPAQRLAERLRAEGDCLVFTGYCNAKGYGVMAFGHQRNEMAHRVAWMIASDQPVPDGMYVLHSCDNPPCCNPDHLRVGTAAENSADMLARKRHWVPSGERNPRTKYTAATVELVRRLTAEGVPTAEIATRTGMTPGYVRNLARGKRRPTSAGGPVDSPRRTRRRLPYERIAAEYASGVPTVELARRYGTHTGNVSRIAHRMGVKRRLGQLS